MKINLGTFLFFTSIIIGFSQEPTVGLILNTDESFNGYTLYSNNETTYLIDNCGYVVNSWLSDYKTGHGVYLTSDGNLLRQGSVSGSFDAGGRGGIFELYSWDGQLIWSFEMHSDEHHSHHDMALLPNGNFLCTVWDRHSEKEAKEKGRIYNGEVWSERIVELKIKNDNKADIVWSWDSWDHLIQDRFPQLNNYGVIDEHPEKIDINFIGADRETFGNWLHVNAISYNASLDQIALSSRNLSEIYIIDHSTTTLEAASNSGGTYNKGGDILYRYGNPQVYNQGTSSDQILDGQHDIRWIENGPYKDQGFMVFNNEYIAQQVSSIHLWRSPAASDGSYHYNDQLGYGIDTTLEIILINNLYSDILSGASYLPNGNLLILEGRTGLMQEYNEEHELVWYYINPVNRNGNPAIQGADPKFNSLFRIKRYGSDFIGFSGKNLNPKIPVEISPYNYECEIYEELSTAVLTIDIELELTIIENPVKNYLTIQNNTEQEAIINLMDINGRPALSYKLEMGLNYINISDYRSGIYIVNIQLQNGGLINRKIVKM